MFDESHLLLVLSLSLWCVVHSAMISIRGIEMGKRILKKHFRFYRIFYNSIAIITLVPIYLIQKSATSVSLIVWTGGFHLIQFCLILLGLFFLLAGAQQYDGMQFMGLRQILSKDHAITLSESGTLQTSGILAVTRHPWYVAGFLVLWARDINSVSLIINIVFSIYLVWGALLEEKKLVQKFGPVYFDYQKRVSMFFPFKWIVAWFRS